MILDFIIQLSANIFFFWLNSIDFLNEFIQVIQRIKIHKALLKFLGAIFLFLYIYIYIYIWLSESQL